MPAGSGPRLGIDYGAASTVAVLAWPDGRWSTLTLDGGPVWPSAVYVESVDQLVAGSRAWQRAQENPVRLLRSPLRAGSGSVAVDGVDVAVQDAVAATLRLVCDEAARVVGAPVMDVRLVVPAGWGPKRRTWMRQAAYRAGLGQPTLVEAPVAAGEQLLAQGVQLRVGEFVMVCDAGAGFEVTVLRRGPSGFEVLSTLTDQEAGGDRVDGLLAAAMTAVDAAVGQPSLSAGEDVLVRAGAQVAKEGLSRAAAVTVPMPAPRPAIVVTTTMAITAAGPAAQRAAELCTDAIAAAELTADQLAGVYLVGGSAHLPAFAEAIEQRLGAAPTVLSEPALVAVYGAIRAGGGVSLHPAEVGVPVPVVPVPPFRRVAAMAVPGLLSLALVAHFLYTADYGGGGSRGYRPAYSWLIANWGELATACLMALVGCLAAGSVMSALTAGLERAGTRRAPVPPAAQTATGILAATAFGASIAGLYAVLGAAYTGGEMAPFLRWSLLPITPVAVAAVAIAVVAARLGRVPVQGWDGFLAFPVSSVLAASVGTLLVQQSMKSAQPGVTGRVGGLLIGVGIACALVSRWILRMILALPLAVVVASLVSWPGTGILAVVYAVAVGLWWAGRLWMLLRSPVTAADPPVPAGAWLGG
jgi:hypothetical protein